jgi:hypothetical protein
VGEFLNSGKQECPHFFGSGDDMLDRLLPERIDNTYRGHWLAIWLLGMLVLLKGAIGLGTVFKGRSAAIDADGIPLDTFTTAGAEAFVALLAAWGVAQIVLNLFGWLVLVRYRAMVPLMFLLLLAEHLGRRFVFWVLPIPRIGAPPGFFINLLLIAALVAGLALSLWTPGTPRHPSQ